MRRALSRSQSKPAQRWPAGGSAQVGAAGQCRARKKDAHLSGFKAGFVQHFGELGPNLWQDVLGMVAFLGENILAFVNLLRGRAQFRWADAFLVMQECGPEALAIVALINCLIGLILAFVGAVELQRSGASPRDHPDAIATTLSG